MKKQILVALPAVIICASILAGDLILTPRYSEVADEFVANLDRSKPENASSINSASSSDDKEELSDEVVGEVSDNPFGPKLEYFSFIEPIAGTFFDVGTNYVFNVSIATNLSPVIENPFDTEFERLTTILKPIVVDETIGLKRNDLFSDMFREKLGRLLVSSFNNKLLNAGFDPIIANVEIIDFWAP